MRAGSQGQWCGKLAWNSGVSSTCRHSPSSLRKGFWALELGAQATHQYFMCFSWGGGIAGTPMELMLLNQILVALWGIDLAGCLLQLVNPRMLLSRGIRWDPEKGRDRPLNFQGAHNQPFPVWPCTLLPSNPLPSSTWQAFLCRLHALSQPTALPPAQFGFPPAAGG